MSEEAEERPPRVLRFLNDYRKQLSLLKIKSFYASHLCKRACLEGRLQANNEACLKDCDDWLNKFYEIKAQKNPDPEEMVLVSSAEVPEPQRPEYERGVAKLRMSLKTYLEELQGLVD